MAARVAIGGQQSLLRFIGWRVAFCGALLLVAGLASFLLVDAAPGDRAMRLLVAAGDLPDPERAEELRRQLGLDRPVAERFGTWLAATLRGDLGLSLVSGRPVAEIILRDAPPTFLLMGVGLALVTALALVLGLAHGLRPRSVGGRMIGAFVLAVYSVPALVVCLLLIVAFAILWPVLPAGGISDPGAAPGLLQISRHLVLPVAAVVLGPLLGGAIRVVSAAADEAARSGHVLAARLRGLSRGQVLLHHVARPALVPLVAQLGVSAVLLVEGTYVVEVVFNWPGLGRAAIDAALFQDQTVLSAIVLVTGIIVVAGALAAELVLMLLDPRQRRGLGV